MQACGLESPEFNSDTNAPANQDSVNPPTDTDTETDADLEGGDHPGLALYAEQCASCHGETGKGGAGGAPLNTSTPLATLVQSIETTMPLGNASKCDRACSEKVADYIKAGFPVSGSWTSDDDDSSDDDSSNDDPSDDDSSNDDPSDDDSSNDDPSDDDSSNDDPSDADSSNDDPSDDDSSNADPSDDDSSNDDPSDDDSSNDDPSDDDSSNDDPSNTEPRITCGPTSDANNTMAGAGFSSGHTLQSNLAFITNASVASGSAEEIAQGKTEYEDPNKYCAGCHGLDGRGSGSDSAIIDPTKSLYEGLSLTDYIAEKMPGFNPGLCEGQCAANIASYIRSWADEDPVDDDDTDAGSCSAVQYGPRSLRVLTDREFSNSIEHLTGINIRRHLGDSVADALPADLLIDGYSNNVIANIDNGTLKSYEFVVNKVVDELKERDFESIIDCDAHGNADACVSAFLNDYVPRVFRRPITDQERGLYRQMFAVELTGGSLDDGFDLALKTLFTSPQFLYRDETGISVAELNNGNPSGGSCGVPSGTIHTLVSEAEPKTLALHGNFGDNVQMTGKDLLEITVKGVQNPTTGLWPVMRIQLANANVVVLTIDHDYEKTYQFVAENYTGQNYLQMFNMQTDAPDSYIAGQELIVSAVTVSEASPADQSLPQTDEPLDDDAYVLTDHQLASYLAFTFTGTTPDDTLLAAADRGELSTDEQIEAQVERLLNTQNARNHFGDFAAQWLRTDKVMDLNKDTDLYPGWTPAVQAAMAQEVREVFNHVVLDEAEAFTTLFNGNYTFANQALAEFYGISAVAGDELQKVTGVSSRAGLVTSGAFMAVHAHENETAPILRATYLRRRMLCQYVPAPPTGVSLNPDGSEVNVDEERQASIEAWEAYLEANNGLATARKKYEHQTSASLCQSCHKEMINPLGFGMEDYDAVGLPQIMEHNGLDVDASGQLIGVGSVNDGQIISFDGARDLANQIAPLDVTRACFVDNLFRQAMGTGSTYFDRDLDIGLSAREKQDYTCQVNALEDVMSANQNSTTELLKALATMSTVRYRKDVER
ncbi:DUF1592 domain-containing protein [Saccharospirillum alexandrii]|uniref:DUF1592 domain-containing protein n=1 Tax=Saccharospirillum alexandrii TaxID=2448477 RepID=UPI001C700521|nr:DUF1592 domain-containing protein [Saccharospirillum alexandrii]